MRTFRLDFEDIKKILGLELLTTAEHLAVLDRLREVNELMIQAGEIADEDLRLIREFELADYTLELHDDEDQKILTAMALLELPSMIELTNEPRWNRTQSSGTETWISVPEIRDRNLRELRGVTRHFRESIDQLHAAYPKEIQHSQGFTVSWTGLYEHVPNDQGGHSPRKIIDIEHPHWHRRVDIFWSVPTATPLKFEEHRLELPATRTWIDVWREVDAIFRQQDQLTVSIVNVYASDDEDKPLRVHVVFTERP